MDSRTEKVATARVAETITFEGGHYTVGISWKEGEQALKNNYDAALTRLKSQEKSLKRKGTDIMNAYSHVFREYEKEGYIKKFSTPESNCNVQWLLPHFPVIRPDIDTTKVRVVFDAAMKYEGKSLNDAMRPSLKLQREDVDVLTRFRKARVVLMADISEMFLQIRLREEDRSYHHFLSRDFDASKEPDVYDGCYSETQHRPFNRSMSSITTPKLIEPNFRGGRIHGRFHVRERFIGLH